MKSIVWIFFSFLYVNIIYAQKLCNEDSVMSLIGKWKYGKSDNMVKNKNLPFIVSRIDEVRKMFQYAYPEPRGTTAEWYRNMDGYPLIPGGPIPYSFNSVFQYWYCNKNTNSLQLSGETANWGFVNFNSFSGFFWEQWDTLVVKVDNSTVYILPNPSAEWKGHKLYGFSDNRSSIVLTSNNKNPWKFISQKQYLDALIVYWNHEKKKSSDGYDAIIAGRKETIKEWQDKKDITPQMKADMVKSLQDDLELWIKNSPDQLKMINKNYHDKIELANNYMKNNRAELEKPAIIERDPDMFNNFSGKFSEIGKGGQYLVIIDPAYFNKQLPAYLPQLMILTWKCENNKAGLYWNKQMMENFPVEKLAGMLNK